MKRGVSGLSFVIAVDKPSGMTSHDVVNYCRRSFCERRVGHTGTLDPLASGVLLIMVGPATRLCSYLSNHDKRYRARISFGASTTTDDAAGVVTQTFDIPSCVYEKNYARAFVADMSGAHQQVPPAYSALKFKGKKACDEARHGVSISLSPRLIYIYESSLLDMGCGAGLHLSLGDIPLDNLKAEPPFWDIEAHVSKGTYIRAIARDIGIFIGCGAYLSQLRRLSSGNVTQDMCMSLDMLSDKHAFSILNPIALLGFRFAYLSEVLASRVLSGATLNASLLVLYVQQVEANDVYESEDPPYDGELISMTYENRLLAIYRFNDASKTYQAECVFSVGVSCGGEA